MCNTECFVFNAKNLTREEIEGKRVIEVGSFDINGGLRPLIKLLNPAEYIGIDIEKGPGVDIVCNAEDLIEKFGKESFDIVITNELIEHVKNWKKVISNFKNICRPGGIILITTRSKGFGYHACPFDFWRYEISDMKKIFSDSKILVLEKEILSPGVFIKVKKPNNFVEKNLFDYKLYSIVTNSRVKEITKRDYRNFYFKSLVFKEKVGRRLSVIIEKIFR